MTLKPPVFLIKLQIFASQSFIIICKNRRIMTDSTVDTVLPLSACLSAVPAQADAGKRLTP